MQNVRAWFSQRCRRRLNLPRWTIHWSGRQVYYKKNVKKVISLQNTLYTKNTGKRLPDVEDIAEADVDCEVSDPEDATDTAERSDPEPEDTKDVRPFHFLQRALTKLWNGLDADEKKTYDQTALKWREDGPTQDEKRR